MAGILLIREGFPSAFKAELQPKITAAQEGSRGSNVLPVFSPFSFKLSLDEGDCRFRQAQWHWAWSMGCGKGGELCLLLLPKPLYKQKCGD